MELGISAPFMKYDSWTGIDIEGWPIENMITRREGLVLTPKNGAFTSLKGRRQDRILGRPLVGWEAFQGYGDRNWRS